MVEPISTANAPSLDSYPISQAVVHEGTVYVAGQVGLDPETDNIVSDDVGDQTHQTLSNVEAILEAAGSSLDRVLSATIYLQDMADFETVNEAYAEEVSEPFPARSAVEVDNLAGEFDVEIEVIAAV